MNYVSADGIRRFADAFSRRELAELQSAVTEDFLLVPVRVLFENITYHGRSGLEEWLADITDRWEEVRLEVDEIQEPAPDLMLVVGRVLGRRRKDRGAALDATVAWVIRGRDGLIASIESFIDRDAAIQAAAEVD